jgi:serine/threonine-protein kinase haspin
LRKEKAYFEEVDAFELMEESPSPKASWTRGMEQNHIDHDLPAILERWKISKIARRVSSEPLFHIMETPIMPSVLSNNSTSSSLFRTPEKDTGSGTHTTGRAIPLGYTDISLKSTAKETNIVSSFGKLNIKEETVEASIRWSSEALTAFEQLLMVGVSTLQHKYCSTFCMVLWFTVLMKLFMKIVS